MNYSQSVPNFLVPTRPSTTKGRSGNTFREQVHSAYRKNTDSVVVPSSIEEKEKDFKNAKINHAMNLVSMIDQAENKKNRKPILQKEINLELKKKNNLNSSKAFTSKK